MKKIFLFAFAALAAINVSALTYNFSDAEFVAQDYVENTTIKNITILADATQKVTIDASNKTIDGESFSKRVKLNGTGTLTYRALQFAVTGSCTIDFYLASASSSADRSMDVYAGEEKIGTVSAPGTPAKQSFNYTGTEAATITVLSPNSGVNLYGINVTYGEVTVLTGKPVASAAAGIYFEDFKVALSAVPSDQIMYSLDNAEYVAYTDSIEIVGVGKHNLKAFATLAGSANSDTISVDYDRQVFVPRVVFNAREVYTYDSIKVADITFKDSQRAEIGTYTMDGVDAPSVKYINGKNYDGTQDSTMTVYFKGNQKVGFTYKNGSDKANIIKTAYNFMQVDGSNMVIEFNEVQAGDTIVLVLTNKGAASAEFSSTYSTVCNVEPFEPEDDNDPLYNLEIVSTAQDARVDQNYVGYTDLVYVVKEGKTTARLKETKAGFRLAKVLIGAYRGEAPAPQGIKNVEVVKATKTIENGQLVIIKNGKKFNAMGAQL